MPSYDYHCAKNGRVIEVKHSMALRLQTWGEVCAHAGIAADDTPQDSPVQRLITGGHVVHGSALKNPEPPCASGPCCGGGMCEMN